MSTLRNIELIIHQPRQHWVGDGFHVSNYFPSGKNLLTRFSPFLLLDYNPKEFFQPSLEPRGVGAHPHRGFETVTFAFEGSVEHHDNHMNHGIIYPGDVQWMTAGSGVMHKEYHESSFQEKGGFFHMIQLWVNLPKDLKMTTPSYQALTSDTFGKVQEEGLEVTVFAGNYLQGKGSARTHSPMNIYKVDLTEGKSVILNEPSNFNFGLLVIKGEIVVNQETISNSDFVLFENTEGSVDIKASEESSFVVLSGLPLEGNVVAYGPFVMSSKEEINQAYFDFQQGKFGTEDF